MGYHNQFNSLQQSSATLKKRLLNTRIFLYIFLWAVFVGSDVFIE